MNNAPPFGDGHNIYSNDIRQYDYQSFLFADDAVVFAPSAKGLKKLLDACSKFAVTHNVIFNVIKSQCLIVQSRTALSYRPTFRLCGDAVPYTESCTWVILSTPI